MEVWIYEPIDHHVVCIYNIPAHCIPSVPTDTYTNTETGPSTQTACHSAHISSINMNIYTRTIPIYIFAYKWKYKKVHKLSLFTGFHLI